jgi:hypothetical protein
MSSLYLELVGLWELRLVGSVGDDGARKLVEFVPVLPRARAARDFAARPFSPFCLYQSYHGI